ncbi:MAG: AzlD domain-containing protein [Azospirillaceae bacterium]
MDQHAVFLIILGMTAVTYLPRLLPALLLSSRRLPRPVEIWLGYVPAAVLAAMLAPTLVLRDGAIALGFDNLFLWAAVPTTLVAIATRSLFATVLAGMAVVAATRWFTGA